MTNINQILKRLVKDLKEEIFLLRSEKLYYSRSFLITFSYCLYNKYFFNSLINVLRTC